MIETIHIAHSFSRKHGGNFHVRAYVNRDGWKHTQCISNADTLAEAETLALDKIRADYRRSGLSLPVETINSGKMSAVMVDHWMF